nr:hypothetical protein [uncultured Aminipila sp.]
MGGIYTNEKGMEYPQPDKPIKNPIVVEKETKQDGKNKNII